MARYIDAELAIKKCNKLLDSAENCPNPDALEGIEIVRNLILSDCETAVPTADVVPKSEVAEIIEEAFKMMQDNFVTTPIYKVFPSDLKAELKKKYTEETKVGEYNE